MTAYLHNLDLIRKELVRQPQLDLASLHGYARQTFALIKGCLECRKDSKLNPYQLATDLARSLENPEDDPLASPAQWRTDILFAIQLCLHIMLVNSTQISA